MIDKSRGEIEAELANAIIQFEKDHLGRGPVDTRVYIIDDLIIVRLRGILTPAEFKLAEKPEGHDLIKQVRRQLLEGSRPILETIVHEKTGYQVVSLHTDISVKNSERMIIFTLNGKLETRKEQHRKKSNENIP